MNITLIMHRDLSDGDCFTEPDKVAAIVIPEDESVQDVLDKLEDECCEHDFYYTVNVRI